MKKMVFAFAIAAALVVALFSTGAVFAQDDVTPQAPGTMGMYGQRGGPRGAGGLAIGDGILHDELIAYYAGALNLSVDELNARLEAGETLAQIAIAQGLTTEQFSQLMIDARTLAADQAVASGDMTQEQAEWMSQRGANRMNSTSGYGRGTARGMGVRGAYAGTQDCPVYPQTTTP